MPDHTQPRRQQPWDVAIIGTGGAGLAIASACLRAGRRVVIFERGAPSRLDRGALLATARRAALGQQPPPWEAWHRRAARPSLAAFAAHGADIVEASAHFIAPDCLEAASRSYPFRHAVIAAGRSPLVPDLPGLASLPWLTPDTIGALEEKPEHLVILGGGAEAVALAQAHALLGCRVSLVQAEPNILPGEDLELVDPLRHYLRRSGVTLHENNAVLGAEFAGAGIALRLDGGARVEGSHLLLALGRVPNLAPLDLPAGRVPASARGVSVRKDLRSPDNARVWAAGSIADTGWPSAPRGQHAAIVTAGLLQGPRAALGETPPPRLAATLPALAQIGLSEREAKQAGHDPQVLRLPLDSTAHGPGIAKLVAGKDGRLLGASLLAPAAAEAAAMLALALERGLTARELAAQPLPAGTLGEALASAATGLPGAEFTSSPMRRILGALDRWH